MPSKILKRQHSDKAIAPKVSVIVPVYNTRKYIAECIDSIFAQTFQDFEIICINDGSTDNSLSVLKKYAKRDSRIRIITQKNSGTSAARNNAIKTASAKYIYPLDSDDKIAPTCLKELYKIITTTNYAVVCSDIILFGKEHGTCDLPKPTKFNMYTNRNGIHNSAMYAKKDWEQLGGYSEELSHLGLEDYDFWLKFLDHGKKVTRISKPLFYYRMKSIKESRNKKVNKNHLKSIDKFLYRNHPKMHLYRLLLRISILFKNPLKPLKSIVKCFTRMV